MLQAPYMQTTHVYPCVENNFFPSALRLREFLERKKNTQALKNLTLQTVIKRLWPPSKNALLEDLITLLISLKVTQ